MDWFWTLKLNIIQNMIVGNSADYIVYFVTRICNEPDRKQTQSSPIIYDCEPRLSIYNSDDTMTIMIWHDSLSIDDTIVILCHNDIICVTATHAIFIGIDGASERGRRFCHWHWPIDDKLINFVLYCMFSYSMCVVWKTQSFQEQI